MELQATVKDNTRNRTRTKYVYFFGAGKTEGNAGMKNLLGGKGSNLAEMTNLGIPVPPGFTISTEACIHFYKNNRQYPEGLMEEIEQHLKKLETVMGKRFGDSSNPLLVSVRSGARVSMPGMMDTVLNLGLNDNTVKGLIQKSKNERFAYDAYRRFCAMFGNVVLDVSHEEFEHILDKKKKQKKVKLDTELDAKDLKGLVAEYKSLIKKKTKAPFPEDPRKQLKMAIDAVFGSWNNKRAITYRNLHGISHDWGTAVNVQTMVFGNLGKDSGTGVAFTRDPATGDKKFYGEYLMNAQGEDVVAGVRTPHPITDLKKEMPRAYGQLVDIYKKLETHYKDMQDLEFTIEDKKLYLLQTRTGKRTAQAAVKIAVDMVKEGLIDKECAILRVEPQQLDQLLHPMLDPKAKVTPIAKGLPASPGAAVGKVVFTASKAVQMAGKKEKVVLVRLETSPEDVGGMAVAQGILTARGGVTCIAGEALILTDKGFFTAEEAFCRLSNKQNFNILSYDYKSSLPKWKRIIAAGRRESEVLKIKVSQTGRTEHNFLRITPDHKMYTFQNRKLIKKRLGDILNNKEYICLIDKIPQPETVNAINMDPSSQLSLLNGRGSNEKLAYLVGAILTDGCINLKRTKGRVVFTQKKVTKKEVFIEQVNSYFYQVFGTKFSLPRTKVSGSYLRGRYIYGEVIDLISFKRKPAEILTGISNNLVSWALSLDETSSLNFLAGAIDGDGTFHSYENNRIMLYVSKEPLAQAIIVACLKLGIVPQVTVNRNIYNIQILEKLDKILHYTKRVRADLRKRVYGTKLFAARSIFSDIVDEVNFMGRTRECIKRNLLIDAEKIKRDILPICSSNPVRPQLEDVLNSNLRMYRIKKVEDSEHTSLVYNFEVDAKDEMDKNYIVFTKMFTPLLVSNSHAAVVGRGMGKCCVVGCSDITIHTKDKYFIVKGKKVKEGDYITLNGNTGDVILGQVNLIEPQVTGGFGVLMDWADRVRKLGVRTNADTPHDSQVARDFGAEGIGLCRTEHMFFGKDRISLVREMILAEDKPKRKKALAKLMPLQKKDFRGIFKVMKGLPVTIRLLDPPLHEFLPHTDKEIEEMAKQMKVKKKKIADLVQNLHELNPMLGHRGCRLGITYPEIYRMQVRAIFEAACELAKGGEKVIPEVMIPLVGHINEFIFTKRHAVEVAEEVIKKYKVKLKYSIGTMIELPRAAITADEIAKEAEFFSFGTNDLTQTGFGFSRDDIAKFLPSYIESGILKNNPFATIDKAGIGELVRIGVEKGRKARPNLKIGICGEHGGDPESVEFCHQVGLDYVSCSPFRVPIARLAAAHAAIKDK